MPQEENLPMTPSDGSDDFVDLDLNPETFQELGYHVVDMLAEYYASIRERSVFSPHTSTEVEQAFDEPLPEVGQDPKQVLEAWRSKILPYATHLGSPRYFGYVNGSGTMVATLADALAAAVNMNPGGWKAAPAATELERRTIAWIAELIGYPEGCGGIFTSGGTMANFTGILTALRNTAPYDTTDDGLQRDDFEGRFTLYMSDHEGHISISRVADLLNLGRNAVRRVASHDDFTMDVQDLERVLDEDIASGDVPFCVVAQVGSINVGAVDPLEEIAKVCRERGIWLHADGACGAVGAMLPEKKALYKGLELADSVTLDPHKWLYIPYECGCVLVQDPEKMRRAFSMSAPYLRGTIPTEYNGMDFFEYGPQMSRGFRALKVWMSMKHYGVEGYRTLLRQNLRCAEHLDRLVRQSSDFEALHEPTLFIYSFRYAPEKLRRQAEESPEKSEVVESYLDKLNQQIADEIQLSGVAFIMTTKVHGRVVLRLSICSHRTTLEDIELVFEKLHELGRGLLS
jgi:glutamate/tyrosine decarboxylase-like PLP-dependent enzyme